MHLRVIKRLDDASIACEKTEAFLRDVSRQAFVESDLLRSAVERQLEIIGEALNLASKEDENLVQKIPDLPRIVGLRNRLIHGYDAVDPEIVWDIVHHNLPALHQQLKQSIESQH